MLSLGELVQATGAEVIGDADGRRLLGFAYDSRADCRDRVFVAIRTETGDGHDYLAAAVAAGAGAVLCERPPRQSLAVPVLVVPDAMAALSDWATAAVRAWGPRVVAVTGSLGKTTTKELVALVLGTRFRVAASPGNLSGRLGLPIALAEMDRGAQVAVLEFATDSFGEMAALAAIAPPDVLVVTNVCEPHLDVFGSPEASAAEMASAFGGLRWPGTAVLNRDDPRVWAMRESAGDGVIGFGAGGDVQADDVSLGADGLRFTATIGGERRPASVRLYSPALVPDCLAAVAAGLALGLGPDECIRGLEAMVPVPGRLSPVPTPSGATILDDTFSACPTSTLAALQGLASYPARRRLLVLGDVDDTSMYDDWSGALAAASGQAADEVWALGDLAAEVARRLPAGSNGHVFYSLPELARSVKAAIGEGDVVLVKGGRGSRLERLVADLAAPEARGRLVRQEAHWRSVRLARPERPTWVEIDVEVLAENTRLICRAVGVPVIAVLKADAYGHGAVRVARVVTANGAASLAVACLSEAKVLRQAGVRAPILVLGYTPPWQAREAVRLEVATAVFGDEQADALSRAARALGSLARVHVKVDTGMARLGLTPEETPSFLGMLSRLPGTQVDGVFTHFGSADDPDSGYTERQLDAFLRLLAVLEQQGLRPPIAHAANTAAALTLPAARLDAVRVGIGLYGLQPSATVALPQGCRAVLAFKTTVGQVKVVPAGTFVGYGKAHLTEGERRIATIPVGYADGFRRGPANWGEVLIRGRRCPIIGNVCMDQAMVDVSQEPDVAKGDEVVLIGRQGAAGISADEVAVRLGTVAYEVVSAILARVPRTV
ncbi:MAG: alanine racemase [Anaerolineae bacterium]